MSTRDIVVHLSTNVFAGSDTTAISLRAIIYFLCRNPIVLKKMLAEVDGADAAGKLSNPITYKESTTVLLYLGAIIKEAMRLHPSVGLLMERHVPVGGLDIHGRHLRAGTIVGINPWVTNRDRDTFPDPEAFKPERWLEASEAQRKRMDMLWELNFGGGSRKCIGRNISWIEIVSSLLFEFHQGDDFIEDGADEMNSARSSQSCIVILRSAWHTQSGIGRSQITGSYSRRVWIAICGRGRRAHRRAMPVCLAT